MVGYMKTFTPIAELTKIMPLAGDMPVLLRFIGISELAAGLGLLLPAALRIEPRLTVLAAAGVALIMVLATIFHLSRGEYSAIGTTGVLGLLAGIVVWGRTRKAPILARRESSHALNKEEI